MDELEETLEGVVSLYVFLENLGLKKARIFRDAVWGWEILEGARRVSASDARSEVESWNGAAAQGEIAKGRGARGPSHATARLSIDDL